MTEIALSYVTIRYKAPIVYFIYKEGTQLGFPEIKELIKYAEKLSGGKPYVTFSDVTVDMNLTEEGKKFVANLDNMPLFRGTAALVKNNMFSFAANFMNAFSKKTYPFKAFVKEEKAIEWLQSLPLY
jgi:hypothetical protein